MQCYRVLETLLHNPWIVPRASALGMWFLYLCPPRYILIFTHISVAGHRTYGTYIAIHHNDWHRPGTVGNRPATSQLSFPRRRESRGAIKYKESAISFLSPLPPLSIWWVRAATHHREDPSVLNPPYTLCAAQNVGHVQRYIGGYCKNNQGL